MKITTQISIRYIKDDMYHGLYIYYPYYIGYYYQDKKKSFLIKKW